MSKALQMRIITAKASAALCIGLCMLAGASSAAAQFMGEQTGCYNGSMVANPNRPTVANPADITQYGVLEIEYGWDRAWLRGGGRQTDLAGLLKFGLLCDVELRWTTTDFLLLSNAGQSRRGFGDNWLGPQIRFYRQTRHVPTLAFSYAVKIPSASSEEGLGSGRVDHAFTFLASKDIRGTHFDANASAFLIGRPNTAGFDRNAQLNLAFSHPVHGPLGITGEIYGDTRLSATTPGLVSTLWALTYDLQPRLVIDGGIDVGLSAGAPTKRVFAGVTYSIANLYTALRRTRRSQPGP